MGIINVLDTQIANMIAAGEVVERPASAIKELIENAIDAKATKITAEIKNGGVSFMRVADNGCGMSREDVPLCILRHATSKIREKADLNGIATLGFRGEALAAIASVSHLRIMTKRPSDELGTLLDVKYGKIDSISEIGCQNGTTIIVEGLFENVPARKKFLKRDISEANAVAAVMEKLALSHPEISLKFISDGNIKYVTAGDGNLKNVIYAVLGRSFAHSVAQVRDMTDGVTVEGYIGTPENVKGNHNSQNFFINGRYIKSLTAQSALDQAFRSYIQPNKFPCCVLNLSVHPAFVDVNVHPQKLEVKFSNDNAIFNAVYCAVRNTLITGMSRPELNTEPKTRHTSDDYKIFKNIVNEKLEDADAARAVADEVEALGVGYEQIEINTNAALQKKYDFAPIVEKPREDSAAQETDSKKAGGYSENHLNSLNIANIAGSIGKSVLSGISEADKTDGTENNVTKENPQQPEQDMTLLRTFIFKDYSQTDIEETAEAKNEEHAEESMPSAPQDQLLPNAEDAPETIMKEPEELPWYRILGVAFNCYIFIEMRDKMMIIDKHAAHERILFENMRQTLKDYDHISQILLIPIELSLCHEAFSAAYEHADEIKSVGYDFSLNQESNIITVVQIPAGIPTAAATEAFEMLCDKLASGTGNAKNEIHDLYESALYQASCKAAVKGGISDDDAHIKWVCDTVLSRPEIKFCPHGRPVAFEISKHQIEKRFERS